MGCLLVVISAAMPRLGFFLFWILRPARVDAAFNTILFPLMGIVFFPLATLLYSVLYSPGGLTGGEWFWVGVAGLFDILHTVTARRSEVSSFHFS